MDSNKLQREKDRLEESIELAWMGIDNAGELEVENPFDNRTKEEIENPHEYVLSLMLEPPLDKLRWFLNIVKQSGTTLLFLETLLVAMVVMDRVETLTAALVF
jgi:hypothetical protein